jgi:hypothetical protein
MMLIFAHNRILVSFQQSGESSFQGCLISFAPHPVALDAHGPPNKVPREGHKGQGEHGDGHSAIMGGSEEIRQCGLLSRVGSGASFSVTGVTHEFCMADTSNSYVLYKIQIGYAHCWE